MWQYCSFVEAPDSVVLEVASEADGEVLVCIAASCLVIFETFGRDVVIGILFNLV